VGTNSYSALHFPCIDCVAYIISDSYEYIFAWSLHQDGGIEIETKLTGVLNLYLAAEGEKDTVDGVSCRFPLFMLLSLR
jgi:Cu2+-containing amine oxidase